METTNTYLTLAERQSVIEAARRAQAKEIARLIDVAAKKALSLLERIAASLSSGPVLPA